MFNYFLILLICKLIFFNIIFYIYPARDTESGGYVAWGHSTCVSPWGDIIAKAQEGEEVVTTTLNMEKVEEMRHNIPCWYQKRDDLYTVSANL